MTKEIETGNMTLQGRVLAARTNELSFIPNTQIDEGQAQSSNCSLAWPTPTYSSTLTLAYTESQNK